MTTNNLTEQWKKGELPKGYYYAEDDGEELIIYIFEKNGSVMGDDFDLKATDWIKPIAPVPSYEEWKSSYNCMFENEALRLKNAQLKELLEEIIADADLSYCDSDIELRIDEVLK